MHSVVWVLVHLVLALDENLRIRSGHQVRPHQKVSGPGTERRKVIMTRHPTSAETMAAKRNVLAPVPCPSLSEREREKERELRERLVGTDISFGHQVRQA